MYYLPLLFFNHEFQDSVCNDCHDWTILCLYISDIAFSTVKNVNYSCIIHSINKLEAINLLTNSMLELLGIDKKYCLNFSLLKTVSFNFFVLYKIVDSEYSIDIYTSVKVSIGTVMKNPEMLK